MGKIVMPKNSALLNEIESVLQIYYEADDWLPNDEYKQKLKLMIGDDQYSSSYTKKAQITSYFGFTVWEDIKNPQSKRKITDSGKSMYEAIEKQNPENIQKVLMESLETVKFGRENYGCPESNSDVEPPALYIRAILDLGYLTYKEFAFLLWKLEDVGANYTDSLLELKAMRTQGSVIIGEEATKYADCKPIMILVRWGFLAEDTEDSSGGKRIIIAPDVKTRYEYRLRNLKIYNIDMNCDEPIVDDQKIKEDSHIIDESERLSTGENVLLYGVPGSGKSYKIEHEYCKDADVVERVVFHPDYTNADFIGQILPVVDEDKQVTYEFTPGPFTDILKDSYENPTKKYVLIIEEINRGNAPAIFGELFQLLDRKISRNNDADYQIGASEYEITNDNMASIIYSKRTNAARRKVRMPSNLSIIATMNISDQNVFTLDTAFQRRWKMRLIENNFDNVRASLANKTILDTGVTWQKFCGTINGIIVGNKTKMASAEDKRLGVYFVHEDILEFDERGKFTNIEDGNGVKKYKNLLEEYNDLLAAKRNGNIADAQKVRLKEIQDATLHNSFFPEKVIKYLWDDAFKFTPEDLFDTTNMKCLEDVIKTFVYKTEGVDRFSIFKQTVRDMLARKS